MNFSFIKTPNSLVINYNGETYTILKENSVYEKVISLIKEKKYDEIADTINIAKSIEKKSNGLFRVVNGSVVTQSGTVVTKFLGERIVEHEKEGLPFEPLVKFADKVKLNPSFRAVNSLYEFLEKNNHPITSEGNFIAYKKVANNFKDLRTGTFDNSPGQIVSMPRNEVDEDPNKTCSFGLHISAYEYCSKHYGSSTDTIIEVEINPKDVVAFPVDYQGQKCRVSEYKSLRVIDKPNENILVFTNNGEVKPAATVALQEEKSKDAEVDEACEDSCEDSCEGDCKDCEDSEEEEEDSNW